VVRLLVAAIAMLVVVSTSGRDTPQQPAAPPASNTNVFWCPMHPDVRAGAPGKCPICSMDLVVIPPRTPGSYRLDVRQIRRDTGTGVRALRIEIRHPATSERVTTFSRLHEQLLHLFIIRRDLSYFSHVHPELAGDGFEATVDLDPGAYMLIADFAPSGGAPQLVQHAIVTSGFRLSPFGSTDLRTDVADKDVDGLRLSLDAQTRVLKPSTLRFSLRDSTTGLPVADLEPFLGASGHLLIVNADLTTAMHSHPELVETERPIGPEVAFAPTFGTPGVYKMWVQFQRGGVVITAPFAVDVK
jgi:hypothetical protein